MSSSKPLPPETWQPRVSREESRDRLFRTRAPAPGTFDFGPDTARVFDDMLQRSVPLYRELQCMVAEIAGAFAVPGSTLYDLGCATGTTFLALDRQLPPGVRLVGIDASEAMLARARAKLQAAGFARPCELRCQDLQALPAIEDASVVILNLTLQFVRPERRAPLIATIAAGLRPGGCLILVEKVRCRTASLDALFTDRHHAFKRRNGYQDLEIMRKRQALEDVLIPYTALENERLLLENGFRRCESFFRWYNFCGLLALV